MTADQVRAHLRYDPDTGHLIWQPGRKRPGQVAGTDKGSGYIMIRVEGRALLAHRLAWLLSTGTWPTGEIDHLNGVKTDNRIANLRDVPRQRNSENTRKARASGATGFLGVSWDNQKKKFQSGIVVNGKRKNLGRFSTAEEAHAAYVAAKRQMHSGCTI